eukprot:8838568-Prorocentrum_lima.AAC.1
MQTTWTAAQSKWKKGVLKWTKAKSPAELYFLAVLQCGWLMPAWFAVETHDGVYIDLREQAPKLSIKLLAQDMQAASDQR